QLCYASCTAPLFSRINLRLMAQSILRFLAAFVFATRPMTTRPPRSSSLSPISTRFSTTLWVGVRPVTRNGCAESTPPPASSF
ncbi:hypothetical protein EDB85DRAFT_1961534, partial [Lactarius pseudohatsudake]